MIAEGQTSKDVLRGRSPHRRRSVIGRWVQIEHKQERYEATVIDAFLESNLAKRVRIQSPGKLQGQVLMASEYAVIEFLD